MERRNRRERGLHSTAQRADCCQVHHSTMISGANDILPIKDLPESANRSLLYRKPSITFFCLKGNTHPLCYCGARSKRRRSPVPVNKIQDLTKVARTALPKLNFHFQGPDMSRAPSFGQAAPRPSSQQTRSATASDAQPRIPAATTWAHGAPMLERCSWPPDYSTLTVNPAADAANRLDRTAWPPTPQPSMLSHGLHSFGLPAEPGPLEKAREGDSPPRDKETTIRYN